MPPDQTSIFVYTVKEDTGFAPNPFHGVCTLATCKPDIRKIAKPGDFVIGKAKAPHGLRAVVVMEVNEILTFDEYWHDPEFACKNLVAMVIQYTPVATTSTIDPPMVVGSKPPPSTMSMTSNTTQERRSPSWWHGTSPTLGRRDRIFRICMTSP